MTKTYTWETLPEDAVWYRTAGPWRGDEIPRGLFHRHNTKLGVWGKLTVLHGALTYYDYQTDSSIRLTAGQYGIIPTQKWHHIILSEDYAPRDIQIQIDFHKQPE